MRTVAPQIKSIQQPIQFLNRQHNGFVDIIWRDFETLGLETLEPKAEAVTLPIQNLHSIPGFVEKDKEHRIKDRHFNIQLDQSS